MGIVVPQPPARDQRVGLGQRRDDRVVGVAEIALVVDDALALEARRLLGEVAIGIDGEGDRRVDASGLEPRTVFLPDLEVLGAMTRRGVDEAGAGVLGDMLAGEQRHIESRSPARVMDAPR